ncbi:DUF397 domain-containing protein [Streptomonospora sp. S1-112]|uniref:DUF397 domain-containing protein n=1 Tax=Streptomonospora mangrovi TaxID=2883123 RepID=A0A9X3NIM1_9ACTN|nr:DUF397 domain-containing protein [Streptomonospora mangrovi]MDA0563755.1 DUF397 domain-containing protein [Streptomonospora mangrovi]
MGPTPASVSGWRKSSYSNQKGGDCVEVADTAPVVLVRDTQNRHLGHLAFSANEWPAFLTAVKATDL